VILNPARCPRRLPPVWASPTPDGDCQGVTGAPARNRRKLPPGCRTGASSLCHCFRGRRRGRVRVASHVISTPPPVVAVRLPLVSASVDGVQNAAEGVSLTLEPRRPLRPPWDRGKVPRRPRVSCAKLGETGVHWRPGRPHAGGVTASKDGERSCLERALLPSAQTAALPGPEARGAQANRPLTGGWPAGKGGHRKYRAQARRSSSFTLCELWRLRASQRVRSAILTLT
jgi:hypothetical protein